jgi:hypothetical protein
VDAGEIFFLKRDDFCGKIVKTARLTTP